MEELNDPFFIKQAQSMLDVEMEPLYWKTEDASYSGKKEQAKSLFMLLLYAAKYNPEIIKKGLKKAYLKRIKQLSFELFGNKVPTEKTPIIIRQSIDPVSVPFDSESELRKYLVQNPHILSEALKDKLYILEEEVKVDHDFKCDIVAKGTKCYPIELKINQANHESVSQCHKYCFYFYRKLRYDRYKEIQGVVIANGFCDWSINELRREGIWCFRIKGHGIEKVTDLF
jgi:hypothetical protein